MALLYLAATRSGAAYGIAKGKRRSRTICHDTLHRFCVKRFAKVGDCFTFWQRTIRRELARFSMVDPRPMSKLRQCYPRIGTGHSIVHLLEAENARQSAQQKTQAPGGSLLKAIKKGFEFAQRLDSLLSRSRDDCWGCLGAANLRQSVLPRGQCLHC